MEAKSEDTNDPNRCLGGMLQFWGSIKCDTTGKGRRGAGRARIRARRGAKRLRVNHWRVEESLPRTRRTLTLVWKARCCGPKFLRPGVAPAACRNTRTAFRGRPHLWRNGIRSSTLLGWAPDGKGQWPTKRVRRPDRQEPEWPRSMC